jgi:hypothetical protein
VDGALSPNRRNGHRNVRGADAELRLNYDLLRKRCTAGRLARATVAGLSLSTFRVETFMDPQNDATELRERTEYLAMPADREEALI